MIAGCILTRKCTTEKESKSIDLHRATKPELEDYLKSVLMDETRKINDRVTTIKERPMVSD